MYLLDIDMKKNMKKYNTLLLFCFLFLAFLSPANSAKEYLSPAEIEKWFNSDDELPIKEVNEGQLNFLEPTPEKKVFHSTINIIIDENSIDNGWIKLQQCYENLDPIHTSAIVYRHRFMKNLKIKSSRNIKLAKVSGHKVLLKDVAKNASLCITAEVRNFYQNEDKSFSIINGPYHRKFLDGYFPYHLTLIIQFSPLLKFSYSIPDPQKGFHIKQKQNELTLDSWFEGRLKTEFRFNLKKSL